MELPNSFSEFLVFIGSPTFIGVIVSVVLVKWAWFVNLESQIKFWIVGGVSVLLPIISRALIIYLPAGALEFINEWYPTIVIGMGVWVSSQVWNKLFGLDGAVSEAKFPE